LVNNEEQDSFKITLNYQNIIQASEYNLPEKLIAISDIEGNFNGFSSFLQINNIIDSNLNWKFGDGHLVLVGDFVDRGENVIPTLWLIYRLEREAEKEGGKVHFIIGNHEVMNMEGNFHYAKDKYKKLAVEIGNKEENRSNYKILFSNNSHLGKWLRSKNAIEKIGDYIFVHAGLSPKILPLNLEINEINQLVRNNIDRNLNRNQNDDEKVNFIMGAEGPFWYRGLRTNKKNYDKINEAQFIEILKRYNAQKIIIGHSIVDDISYDLGKRIIRIDVKHGKTKSSGKTKGLLIEEGQEFKIDDLGNKSKL